MEGLISLLLFAGLFFLMMRFGCGSHVAHGGHGGRGQHTAAEGTNPTRGGVIYTCPMHPEIRQSAPGNCPKCGMALEPHADKGEEQS